MEKIPTLYPTEQEFENPIEYLSNPHIKRLGIRYGMIKIIPTGGLPSPAVNRRAELHVPAENPKSGESRPDKSVQAIFYEAAK